MPQQKDVFRFAKWQFFRKAKGNKGFAPGVLVVRSSPKPQQFGTPYCGKGAFMDETG